MATREPFDARAFIGRTVKELDAALKQHQASNSSPPKDAAFEAAFASMINEAADSNVRRAAALKLGSMRLQKASVERVISQLANAHNCDVGGGAISVRRAALLAFTELARGESQAVVASVSRRRTF